MSGTAYDVPLWRQILRCLIPFREPDFIIGTKEQPYMLRWWVIPRNRWLNVYLHKIVRDDDDRALHDHPWRTVSLYLKGRVRETCQYPLRPEAEWEQGIPAEREWFGEIRELSAPNLVYRSQHFRHRLELIDGKPCWTLFFTGPKLREWGFWCPKGFVVWTEFVDKTDVGNVGRGCGEKA